MHSYSALKSMQPQHQLTNRHAILVKTNKMTERTSVCPSVPQFSQPKFRSLAFNNLNQRNTYRTRRRRLRQQHQEQKSSSSASKNSTIKLYNNNGTHSRTHTHTQRVKTPATTTLQLRTLQHTAKYARQARKCIFYISIRIEQKNTVQRRIKTSARDTCAQNKIIQKSCDNKSGMYYFISIMKFRTILR